jgi:hypothetical protein
MSAQTKLPSLYDPWSRLGDEIAGETADELALNFARVCHLSRFKPLQHEAPEVRRLFRNFSLGIPAQRALDEAEEILRAVQRRDAK